MTDLHWQRLSASAPPLRAERRSFHLPMRDGVRIAVDLHLPASPRPCPAILRQTRYHRALAPRAPLLGPLVATAFDLYARTRRVFLAAGYAWLDVDVRGSGASFGSHPYPWSAAEVRDGAEIVDWIARQSWSSGRVGSLGISYDGTCAERLVEEGHPALAAVAPMFSLYDAFTDVAFPGGVHLAWFTKAWARHNLTLDRNAGPEAFAEVLWLIARAAHAAPAPRGLDRVLARLGGLDHARFRAGAVALLGAAIAGVKPIDGPAGMALLLEAIAAHAGNFDVHEGASAITHRDDRGAWPESPTETIDVISPHVSAARVAASGVPIYGYSGWRDGAYPNGAAKRHLAVPTKGSRLTLGPWVHSGRLRVRPFDLAVPAAFDHDAELLAFFDLHLRAQEDRGDGHPVHYYTLVEDRWKACAAWPPPAERASLHLGAGRSLEGGAPHPGAGVDTLRVDPAAGSGERSRWRSLISLVPGDYPHRRAADARLLAYDAPPLERDLEITGHPSVTIFAAWSEPTLAQLFAYLEDVAPDGRVAYVTEGQLRALHRRAEPAGPLGAPRHSYCKADALPLAAGEVVEMSFELQPISYLFRRGHRVRLALAGGDADHFLPPPASALRVHHGAAHPSRVELPVMLRSS